MRNIIKCCLFLSAIFTPFLVYGDSEAPPRSYAITSSDSKFLFVMIAPLEAQRYENSLSDAARRESQKTRTMYPASGMYLNDGSTTPLWKIDWYSDGVLVASDGIHLVRLGPWARSLSDEAFTFFANGKELRSYKVGDLVESEILLPHSVSHFTWQENMGLDEQRRILSVATLSRERYVFDYTTGEIISASRPIRAIVIASVAVLLFIAFLIIKRRRMFAKGAV
ncbi:MAG: hypothetical protein H0T64_05010 [Pyrinomonadaceae bacterium]|nr:hypothetical protein [Pyrinomonadaceae bacterium]MBA3765912.1 hypothetical protein [Acidobacteriota bacterium]